MGSDSICANDTNLRLIGNCEQEATITCEGCYLVRYCSETCRLAHANLHQAFCHSALSKDDWCPPPVPMDQQGVHSYGKVPTRLWSTTPAVDICQFPLNEGTDKPDEFRCLFTDARDLNKLVQTVASIADHNDTCYEFHVNRDECSYGIHANAARAAILMLIALTSEKSLAVDAMIQIWYSFFITKDVQDVLKNKVLPLFADVRSKVHTKPALQLLSKTWTFGRAKLRLVLHQHAWMQLPTYLEQYDCTDRLIFEGRRDMRVTRGHDIMSGLDVCFLPQGWRVSRERFHWDGMLLPFGASKRPYQVPNPTVWADGKPLPLRVFHHPHLGPNPMNSWNIGTVMALQKYAKNDLYGFLHDYLSDLLGKFQDNLLQLDITVIISQVHSQDIDKVRLGSMVDCFDRIDGQSDKDISLGAMERVLTRFGPCLRKVEENPKATLITMCTTNSCVTIPFQRNVINPANELRRFLPHWLHHDNARTRQHYEAFLMECALRVKDWSLDHARAMGQLRIGSILHTAGIKAKGKNTITAEWPTKMTMDMTAQEVEWLMTTVGGGADRCIEWVRRD